MDTADKVASIDECLYSIGNRIKIAQFLCEVNKTRLLETELEDIYYFIQVMFDEYCIKRENSIKN